MRCDFLLLLQNVLKTLCHY